MKKFFLILLGLAPFMASAQFKEYKWMYSETGFQTQPDWDPAPPATFPSGGARAKLTATNLTLSAILTHTTNIDAGLYRMYVRGYSYTNTARGNTAAVAWAGGPEIVGPIDERDRDGYWNHIGLLDIPTATNTINFLFYKTNSPTTLVWPTDIISVYLTSNTNAIMSSEGYLQNWIYNTNVNAEATTAGNYIYNSSFEMPLQVGGWTAGFNNTREFSLADAWSDEQAHSGTRSMKLYFSSCVTTNKPIIFVTYPALAVRTNMPHTISAWVYPTDSTAQVTLALANPVAVPAGYGLSNQITYSQLFTGLTPGVWQRLVLANQVLLEYPYAYYCPEIRIDASDGGSVYLDDVQVEEGATDTAWVPRTTLELGLHFGRVAGFFPNNVGINIPVYLKSYGPFGNINYVWRLHNHKQAVILSGTNNLSFGAAQLVTSAINLPALPNGGYRLVAYSTVTPYDEVETSFIVGFEPHNLTADQRRMGNHEPGYFWVNQLMSTIGAKLNRALSPGAFFRWSETEKTPNVYTWYDEYVDAIQQGDHPIMANLAQTGMLPWMLRSFITITNRVGTFQIGEVIQQGGSGASGKIVWISNTNDAILNSMQLTNTVGVFDVGDGPILGTTSGATADGHPAFISGGASSMQFNNTPDLTEWSQFVTDVVNHYDYVHEWEIMNEPGSGFPLINADSGVAFYSMIVERSVNIIKSIRPTDVCVILGGMSSTTFGGLTWNHLDPTTRSLSDVFSWHLYQPVGGLSSNMMVFANDRGKQNWNTETGWEDLEDRYGKESGWIYKGIPAEDSTYAEVSLRATWYTPQLISTNIMHSLGAGFRRYYYYDTRPYHNARIRSANYTTVKSDDGLKPKALMLNVAEYLFGGGSGGTPLGGIAGNTNGISAYHLVGYTNSQWLALFAATYTNKYWNWSLATNEYEVYDMWGNKLQPTPVNIPLNFGCTYVRGIGINQATMVNAIQNASWVWVPDNEPPVLVFEYCPRGTVSELEKHRIDIHWFATDNVSQTNPMYPELMQYRYKVNAGAFTGWSAYTHFQLYRPSPGVYTVTVEAQDQAGNTSSINQSFTIP